MAFKYTEDAKRIPYYKGGSVDQKPPFRATGGGSRNAWWLQLIADLSGVPVEVVAKDEPGAFGAAILAGVGAGVYGSVSAAVAQLVTVSNRFEPHPERGARYDDLRRRLSAG